MALRSARTISWMTRIAFHERAESIGDFVLGEQEFPALDLRTRLGMKRWIVRGGRQIHVPLKKPIFGHGYAARSTGRCKAVVQTIRDEPVVARPMARVMVSKATWLAS